MIACQTKLPTRIEHDGQQLGQHMEMLISKGQVFESLLQRTLLRVGSDLQKKVIGCTSAVEVDFQEPVRKLVRRAGYFQ